MNRKSNRNIAGIFKVLLLTCLLSTLFFNTDQAFAEEISGRKKPLDVIFVVDASGSMRSNDPDGIAMEMVKAFVDTVHTTDISVGFVAYNDTIAAAIAPVSMSDQQSREAMKASIDSTVYSGNTDIGLGLAEAYNLLPKAEGTNSIIVLVSDGETDLAGSVTGRTEATSDQDVANVVQNCRENQIPVYTIAFGRYSGSADALTTIANETNAANYAAENPDLLIEVLYGILSDNLAYKIQAVSAGTYAQGRQEINIAINDSYLNEVDVLLISPQKLGSTELYYGDKQIPMTAMNYYAVGKITGEDIDDNVRQITIYTDTANNQPAKAYVIGYRSLEPVLQIETSAARNERIPYEVYFKAADGEIIRDEAFYKNVVWQDSLQQQAAEIQDGYLQGSLLFDRSGDYVWEGQLADELGSYQFYTKLDIHNTPPAGDIPIETITILSKDLSWVLDDCFTDTEDDVLSYTLEVGPGESLELSLEGNVLTMIPHKAGVQSATLLISDGEETLLYPMFLQVVPLWQVYWWVIVLALAVVLAVLLWLRHKRKPEVLHVTEIKAKSHFNGKLNAYFTIQPEDAEEIPPLVFHLYKIKNTKLCMGELLKDYPAAIKALELDKIHLIADEDRRIIFFHTADTTIMIGSSIACRRIQYSISFGDVVYISAPDGSWDLELHYVAMIQ